MNEQSQVSSRDFLPSWFVEATGGAHGVWSARLQQVRKKLHIGKQRNKARPATNFTMLCDKSFSASSWLPKTEGTHGATKSTKSPNHCEAQIPATPVGKGGTYEIPVEMVRDPCGACLTNFKQHEEQHSSIPIKCFCSCLVVLSQVKNLKINQRIIILFDGKTHNWKLESQKNKHQVDCCYTVHQLYCTPL